MEKVFIVEVLKRFFKSECVIYIFLALVSFVFFFNSLGSYRLIDVDEPRYAEAAREMVESNNWITPYFNYNLRFDKPIFHYWLIAGSYKLFGINEFAARFPSALTATLLMFMTYLLGKRFISRRYGVISSVILASSLEFLGMARMSITDMTLAFFICASIISGLLAVSFDGLNNEKSFISKTAWWWLAYLFSGFAVLTKGPVGLVLPAMVLGLYAIFTGKLKDSFKPRYILPGLVIFLITVIPWYWAIISIHGDAFVNYFFLKHNLERFASSGFHQHNQPFYFYIFVVLAGFFPWSLFFAASLVKYIPEIVNKFIAESKNLINFKFDTFRNSDNKTKLLLGTLLWFFIIFLFFSSSRAKLITYILPVFPALGLLTGLLWTEFIENKDCTKSIKIPAVMTAVLAITASLVATFSFNTILPVEVKSDIAQLSWIVPVLFTVPSLIFLWGMFNNKKIVALGSFVVMMMCAIPVAKSSVLPVVYNAGPKDIVNYAQFVKKLPVEDKVFVSYELTKPSIVYYYQQRVPNITRNDYNTLQKYLSHKNLFIVSRNKTVGELPVKYKLKLLYTGKKYSLLTNGSAKYKEAGLE